MSHTVIDASKFGVSFSAKQCHKFRVDTTEALDWLIHEAGFRRFRLMSYWDEHEPSPGQYDFSALDQQLTQIARVGGKITLCLGARQPRWPEFHWPDWAWQSTQLDRTQALLNYVKVVVERYKNNPAIIGWHLENEALLTGFGDRIEIDRARLRQEFALVKQLDPSRPIIMSTSAAWGIPIFGPIPDMVGFSFYLIRWHKNKYSTTYHALWIHRLRAKLIRLIWQKPSFIHELQLEPWGPKDIWEMTTAQQDQSMSPTQITKNLTAGHATHLYPLDLWGGEWWYWRTIKLSDPTTWQAVRTHIQA